MQNCFLHPTTTIGTYFVGDIPRVAQVPRKNEVKQSASSDEVTNITRASSPAEATPVFSGTRTNTMLTLSGALNSRAVFSQPKDWLKQYSAILTMRSGSGPLQRALGNTTE